MIDATTKKTLIEEGTELKGTVNSTCPIVVMGKVEGEVSGPSIEVTESGVLSGKAKVSDLRSRGELAGEFEADTVVLSGRVRDRTSIRARSLEMNLVREEGKLDMTFGGECELAVGDAPDKAQAVKAALAGHGRAVPASPAAPQDTDTVPAMADEVDGGKNKRHGGSKKAETETADMG